MSVTVSAAAQPGWQQWAQRAGFNSHVLVFALRTALAAFVAFVVAKAMGLEHANWAAMSAWASSQPLREHLLSRGMYRFAGSLLGVIYAVGLVLLAQDNLWLLALGLAVWGALCAFWGNAQRGFMVYGWMLAGYSAAMVVLLHHGPAASITDLAWDRMLTVVTGVAAALCVSWCFAPRRKAMVLIGQSRQTLAQVLQAAMAQMQGQPRPAGCESAVLLSRLAEVDELLDLYPEGSTRARRTAQAIHWQQSQAMELLYQLQWLAQGLSSKTLCTPTAAAQLLPVLQAVVQQLQHAPGTDEAQLYRVVQQAGELVQRQIAADTVGNQVLAQVAALLQAVQAGLHAEQHDLGQQEVGEGTSVSIPVTPLHRDWMGARQASVRTGGTMLLVGAAWAWTGSSVMAFCLLGLSVMLLVFSSFESPSRTMLYVLRGQIIGAVLALICQLCVWPLASSSWDMVWMTLPFALMGGLLFAHRRTAMGAMDTNMVMFILLAPRFPDTLGAQAHLSLALAIVAGPALAWGIYRLIYPTQAVVRMRHLLSMMWQQLPAAAVQALQGGTPDAQWRAQLHHRVLRLMRWADKTQWASRSLLPSYGMALRSTQSVVEQLQHWRSTQGAQAPARSLRRAELALRRLSKWQLERAEGGVPQGLQQAWQALAQQPGLPPALAAKVRRVAGHDLAVLAQLQQALQTK